MRRISIALALVALALAAVPATASTFLAMSDVELVTGADAIVQGRIVSQRSLWDQTGRVIVTETVVRVQDPENPQYGYIELKFTGAPIQLRQWVITNDLGEQTTVSLRDLDTGTRLGARPFNITNELRARGFSE